jgi:hypothetical protein
MGIRQYIVAILMYNELAVSEAWLCKRHESRDYILLRITIELLCK